MTLRNPLMCGAIVTVVLAGCGGSSHKASTARSITAAATITTGASTTAARSGIAARLLTNNELPGFTAAAPTVYRSLSAWEQAGYGGAPGFVVGADENLNGPSGREGASMVVQFRSAGAARAALSAELQQFKANDQSYYLPFRVTGVPGALGLGENGSPPGINVAFTSGDYYYLVGEQPPFVTTCNAAQCRNQPKAGTEHTLDAVVQHLYRRLKG